LSEDWFKVVRVNYGIASIFSFGIDVPPSSESVWFSSKITRTKCDNKIELREVLGLLYLSLGQYIGSGKVLKILMIYNNINGIG